MTPAKRQPSLRRGFMMDTVNGSIRVRAWPRERGRSGTPAQIANREKFAEVQRASRFIDPTTYANIVNATQGTPLLPRDIITMMFYNRVCSFKLPDGRELMPTPVPNTVSEALDALGNVEGSTLERTAQGWRAIPPGPDPSALTVARYRCAAQRPIPNYNGFGTILGTIVTHDPLAWIDPATYLIRPSEPGWYLLNADVYSAAAIFWGLATSNAQGLFSRMSGAVSAAQTGMAGSALVPFQGDGDHIAANCATFVAGNLDVADVTNSVTVIGPLAPL